MGKILITGGLGFIGSNFIRYSLAKNGDKIVNLDKITYCGNRGNLRDIEGDERYDFVKGDICDETLVDKLVSDAESVINFAAETHVDRSIDYVDDFLRTNIMGVKVLLEAAKKHRIKKFIQISTDEVYGSLKDGSAAENSPLFPNSPYSASKAAADLLVRSYVVTYNVPAMICRSTNNFGPYQYPEKVVPLFVTNLLENKKLPLYSKGENVRDWIYVEDNCRGIDTVLRKGEIGEIYNIGAGNEITNLELTEKLLSRFGKGEEMIEYVKDRPGHDFRYSLSTEKIENLGFKTKENLDDALDKTIEWYKKNENWWKPLKKDRYTVK